MENKDPMTSNSQQPTDVLSEQTINQRNLEILQKHFPQAIEVDADGRFIINSTKLQLSLDPAGVKVEEDGYEMRWVGKRDAYHNAFLPTQKILNPLPEDSKNWDTTANLLLRGDNIEALRLLRHSYFGAIKLIYIDPPYNTQNDGFIYNDNFSANQTQVLEALGYDAENIDYIKNIYGAKTHSGWLSFMYPRLLLAKDLLRDDGVIFISIDDNEQAQLKLLCDEVFGADSFISSVTIQVNKGGRDYLPIAVTHETLICYALNSEFEGDFIYELPKKDKKFDYVDSRGGFDARELRNRNPKFTKANRPNLAYEVNIDPKSIDLDGFCSISLLPSEKFSVCITPLNSRGQSSVWRWGERKFEENNDILLDKSNIFAKQKADGGWNIYEKHRKLTQKAKSIWDETNVRTEQGTKDFKELFDKAYFDHPKSIFLLKKILTLGMKSDDIVLDFFAGSGTTGEAIMQLNSEDQGTRQFILAQLPQAIDEKKQKEAYKFVTEELGKPATIFEITAERLRRAGASIEAKQAAELAYNKPVDTGFRVFDIIEDTNALILQKPLSDATQEDLDLFIGDLFVEQEEPSANGGAGDDNDNGEDLSTKTSQVLYNLLLAEGLPLSIVPIEVIPQKLYLAQNVAIILSAIDLTVLKSTLENLKNTATPATYLTVYAPWVHDDNFMQGIKTLAESLGYSSDKLRLRGFGF